MEKPIPIWITVVSGLIATLGAFVGCSLYLSPGTFIPGIDFSAPGIAYLAHMWAARQFAIAAIIAYALLRRSAPMLKISLIAYNLMNIQDAGIGIARGDSGLTIGATVAFLFSAAMIAALSMRAGKPAASDGGSPAENARS
jgi:hypothetical protein